MSKARGWLRWPFAKREAPARVREGGNRARVELTSTGPLGSFGGRDATYLAAQFVSRFLAHADAGGNASARVGGRGGCDVPGVGRSRDV